MPRTITVELAGQTYSIEALPIRQSKQWREKLAGPFSELTAILGGAAEINLTSGKDIAALVQTLSGTLIGSLDLLLDLLFDYAPTLEADRERIEAQAFDDEALHAFTEVLKLVYPFGELRGLVSGGKKTPTR
jgi:hypothetical protein